MTELISESRFYLWRTVFALSHADHIVTSEEVTYMAEVLEDVPFSDEQRSVLNDDIKDPQDIAAMFENISEQEDQEGLFKFAHEIVWADGHFAKEEREAMLKLQTMYVANLNIESMVGSVDLELEEGQEDASPAEKKPKDVIGIISSFVKRFGF